VNNLDTISDFLDIADFIGKALHCIATGRAFTEEDAKCAIDAISAAAKISAELTLDNYNEVEEMRRFFNLISESGKDGIDLLSGKNGGNFG